MKKLLALLMIMCASASFASEYELIKWRKVSPVDLIERGRSSVLPIKKLLRLDNMHGRFLKSIYVEGSGYGEMKFRVGRRNEGPTHTASIYGENQLRQFPVNQTLTAGTGPIFLKILKDSNIFVSKIGVVFEGQEGPSGGSCNEPPELGKLKKRISMLTKTLHERENEIQDLKLQIQDLQGQRPGRDHHEAGEFIEVFTGFYCNYSTQAMEAFSLDLNNYRAKYEGCRRNSASTNEDSQLYKSVKINGVCKNIYPTENFNQMCMELESNMPNFEVQVDVTLYGGSSSSVSESCTFTDQRKGKLFKVFANPELNQELLSNPQNTYFGKYYSDKNPSDISISRIKVNDQCFKLNSLISDLPEFEDNDNNVKNYFPIIVNMISEMIQSGELQL